MLNETFFVALAFFTVMAAFVYIGLPRRLMKALDDKAATIQDKLNQAKALRKEAAKVLADYEKQRKQAEKQAEEIISVARDTAQRTADQAKLAMDAQMQRRAKQAELKIARSEEQLMKDVRAAITELAVDAATHLVANGLTSDKAQELVDQNISELPTRLQ
ncbi:ATP F0F1 synthase subunit B [bacterium]|nr:ATP F0F1 synthase subunit B [bacterium]